jgi:rubrerythrin
MERFSITEVIEQAIRTEQLGYRYYSEMAERFKNHEELRDLFETLAKKELVHEERFKELKEIVGEEELEGWDEISEYMRAMVESEFFLGSDKALSKMKENNSIEDAVTYALSFEKETLLYFIGIRRAVKEKDVVDEIINEEQSHIMWLNRFKTRFLKK